MLKQSSVSAVALLTEKVGQAGYAIASLPETPVAALVGRCYNPVVDVKVDGQAALTANDALGVVHELAVRTQQPSENDAPCHGDDLESFVNVLAKTLETNLHMTRNVVNPIIRAVAESVDQARKEASAPQSSLLSVTPAAYEKIWGSAALDNMIDPFKTVATISTVRTVNVHPLITKEELVQLVATGSSRFDEELQAWLAECGEDWAMDTYRMIFGNGQDVAGRPEQGDVAIELNHLLGNHVTERNRNLLIHVIARRLSKDVPEGVDMSVTDYRAMMAGLVEQTGRAICRFLDTRRRDVSQNRMILAWPVQGAEYETRFADMAQITVNPDLYPKWLESGGTPEIILGAFVTDRETDPSKLIADKERYELSWLRRASLVRSRQRSDLFSVTLSAFRKALTEQINALKDSDVPGGTRAPMHQKLNEVMEKLDLAQVERVYDTAKWMVCTIMFPHTDSLKILDTLDNIARDNPELADRPTEAALLASIDILVDWLVQQYDIRKCC